jgi:hypothetical protein
MSNSPDVPQQPSDPVPVAPAPVTAPAVVADGEIRPFQVGAAIAYAWRTTWRNFWWLLLLGLLVTLLTSIANLPTYGSSLAEIDPGDPQSVTTTLSQATFGVLTLVGFVLQVFISIFVGIGLIRIALGATAGEGVKLERMFRLTGFGRYLGASIIIGLIVVVAIAIPVGAGIALTAALNQAVWAAVAILLAIVIAIVASIGFSMFGFVIVDQDVRGLGCLGASWRLVRPHFWGLLGLSILVGMITIGLLVAAFIVGLLLIVIGLLVTIPLAATVCLGLSVLSQGYAYRTLSGQPVR